MYLISVNICLESTSLFLNGSLSNLSLDLGSMWLLEKFEGSLNSFLFVIHSTWSYSLTQYITMPAWTNFLCNEITRGDHVFHED